jgi:hypothetical protein
MFRAAISVIVIAAWTPAVWAERSVTEKTATIDCDKEKDKVIAINHGEGDYTFTGICERIQVRGNANKLTIHMVRELSIVGAANTVTVDGVDKIAVNGAKNTVTYRSAYIQKRTAVAAVGADNKITQKRN